MGLLIVPGAPELAWMEDFADQRGDHRHALQLPALTIGSYTVPPHVVVFGPWFVLAHRGVLGGAVPVHADRHTIQEALDILWSPVTLQHRVPFASLRTWCDLPPALHQPCPRCRGRGQLRLSDELAARVAELITPGETAPTAALRSWAPARERTRSVDCPQCDGARSIPLDPASGYGRLGPLTIDRRDLQPVLPHLAGEDLVGVAWDTALDPDLRLQPLCRHPEWRLSVTSLENVPDAPALETEPVGGHLLV